MKNISLFVLILVIASAGRVMAWSEHPLMAYHALKDLPVWNTQQPVEARTLGQFLVAHEEALAAFLAEHEAWSVQNIPNYKACPKELAFRPGVDGGNIRERFFMAIRVNPGIKVPLYLHLVPGNALHDFYRNSGTTADPREITTLKDLGVMTTTQYVRLHEGELVTPLDVVVTANDEPDYGFDLGLFADNGTFYGARYGFGIQPFGNPNLEYSSQAPFHMGFFHEASILYKFGPFLKETYIEYRIMLYQALAKFAFEQGEPYWGWRFMGWGMHYVADLTMPYHVKPLPGVSTARMMWIDLKAILGAPAARDNAVQLVSNRHTVLEEFQHQVMKQACQQGDPKHPLIMALTQESATIPFSQTTVRDIISAGAAAASVPTDRLLEKYVPQAMVSDPTVEVSQHADLHRLVEVIAQQHGFEGVRLLNDAVAERFTAYGTHVRAYMSSIYATTR